MTRWSRPAWELSLAAWRRSRGPAARRSGPGRCCHRCATCPHHFRPLPPSHRTSCWAAAPGNQLGCAFAEILFAVLPRYTLCCACCSGMGWDAGWRMRHTHSVAPCLCLLLPSRAVCRLLQLSSTSRRSRASSPHPVNLEHIVGSRAKSRRWYGGSGAPP